MTNSSFENNCLNILKELFLLSRNSKSDELYAKYIELRLNQSFDSYQYDLQASLNFLKRRDELRLLRKLNQINK